MIAENMETMPKEQKPARQPYKMPHSVQGRIRNKKRR